MSLKRNPKRNRRNSPDVDNYMSLKSSDVPLKRYKNKLGNYEDSQNVFLCSSKDETPPNMNTSLSSHHVQDNVINPNSSMHVAKKAYLSFRSLAEDFNFASDSEDEKDEEEDSDRNSSEYIPPFDGEAEIDTDSESMPMEIPQTVEMIDKAKAVDKVSSFSTCNSMIFEETEHPVRCVRSTFLNSEIVSMDHPSSVTLYGYVTIHVLSGEISILGYELQADSKIRVFSSENAGLLQIQTTEAKSPISFKRLKSRLRKLKIEEEQVQSIVMQCSRRTAVVRVERSLLPPHMEFLELYYPAAVRSRRECTPAESSVPRMEALCGCEEEGGDVLKVGPHNWDAVEGLKEEISRAVYAGEGCRIMVYGSKQSGKSTLLRYLVNSTLNRCHAVYYLDADPGQTEFTPPAVVSLTKVSAPLLGPTYSHRREPLKMIYTGSVTPERAPKLYVNSVQKLVEFYSTNHSNDIVFMNTMGWVQGLGEVCNREIMKAFNPTIMIEFVTPGQAPVLKEQMLSKNVSYFELKRNETSVSYFSPVDLRNFSLVSYFGRCQKFYDMPTYLNAFRPYVVRWDSIALHVMGKTFESKKLVEAIHGSVVALCHVRESCILDSKAPGHPKTLTLTDKPHNTCLGFGIIRASDETKELLYIVSPLKLEWLKHVNAIIKGNVMVPNTLVLNQDVKGVALPYTDDSKVAPPPSRKSIKNRSRRYTPSKK